MTMTLPDVSVFEAVESRVRSYCRGWPTTFHRARGSRLTDEDGHSYLDFFAGAGSLNYGHNNPVLKRALIGVPGDVPERDPAAARSAVQGDVPRADRHQRRRVGAEAGP